MPRWAQAKGAAFSLSHAGHAAFAQWATFCCACPYSCHVACAAEEQFLAPYGMGREGLFGRQYTTERNHTCEKLYQLVKHRGYLLIKAPPQSGKTSTLQLLSHWAIREHPGLKVVYINLSHEGERLSA